MQPSDATQLGTLAGQAHIRHYRAGLRATDTVYWKNMLAYNAASGAAPMILTDCKPPVGLYQLTTPQALVTFNNDVGNSADAVEAVNEPDTRKSQDANWSSDLDACVGPLVDVLPLPFVAPSMAQASSYPAVGVMPTMQVANIHRYFGGHNPGTASYGAGEAPCGGYGTLAFWICLAQGEAGGAKPIYMTETGWNSQSEVDQTTQAKYSAREILYNFKNGIARTYFYTLVAYTGADGFGGCGLLNVDRTPKPAYYAIKTLLTALADDGSSYTPKAFSYSVSGVSSSVVTMPMQKRDGTTIIAIWNETSSYDTATASDVSVPVQQAAITVPLGEIPTAAVTIGDSGKSSSARFTFVGTTVTVPVDDHVTLVTLKSP